MTQDRTRGDTVMYACWSPDGTRLAFTEDGHRAFVDADI